MALTSTNQNVTGSAIRFYLRTSNADCAPCTPDLTPWSWGNSTDIPVVGDWDNNGTDTMGLYRPVPVTLNGVKVGAQHWYFANQFDRNTIDLATFGYSPADNPSNSTPGSPEPVVAGDADSIPIAGHWEAGQPQQHRVSPGQLR
jgi:hypothetical protein